MSTLTGTTTILAVTAVLVAACAAPAGSGDTGIPSDSALDPSPTAKPSADGSIGQLDPQMIEAVVLQAADDTGVDGGDIAVVSAAAVTWSDGSIGCPEEGMGYTQALVPGYRVVLDVAGEEIHYHAGSDGEFFPCDNPQPPAEGDRTGG